MGRILRLPISALIAAEGTAPISKNIPQQMEYIREIGMDLIHKVGDEIGADYIELITVGATRRRRIYASSYSDRVRGS